MLFWVYNIKVICSFKTTAETSPPSLKLWRVNFLSHFRDSGLVSWERAVTKAKTNLADIRS